MKLTKLFMYISSYEKVSIFNVDRNEYLFNGETNEITNSIIRNICVLNYYVERITVNEKGLLEILIYEFDEDEDEGDEE